MHAIIPNTNAAAIVEEILLKHLNTTDVIVSSADIAREALEIMDPQWESVDDVLYQAFLNLKQIARQKLTTAQRTHQDAVEQMDLFGGALQERYPATRGGDDLYVPRHLLTLSERRINITRLRNEASAKHRHARALEAETEQLIDAGHFLATV